MIRILCFAASLSLLMPNIANSQFYGDDGNRYYYRHVTQKDLYSTPAPVTKLEITATFTGFLGEEFSEDIPVTTNGEIYSWVLASGSLPDGLSLDSSKGKIIGLPIGQVGSSKIALNSLGADGEVVSRANVTIDVLDPGTFIGTPFEFYAHVGKPAFNQLPVPSGVTVDRWVNVYSPPPGIHINQRNFEGTPTATGNYPVVAIGYDFLNNEVARIRGNFLVETGPTFSNIQDQVYPIPANPGYVTINVSPTVYRTIDPSGDIKKIRQFLEISDGGLLPPGVSINHQTGQIYGVVKTPYRVAEVRYRAVDVDGTTGYSNWFRIGSEGPSPDFSQNPLGPFFPIVGSEFQVGFVTKGTPGERFYSLSSGTLPDGLTLDSETGVISGVATTLERQEGIVVRLDVTNNSIVDTTETVPFVIETKLDSVNLSIAEVSPDPLNIRVGTSFSATLDPSGALLEPYSVTVNEDTPLPEGTLFDEANKLFSGSIATAGSHTVNFTLTNGDEQTSQNGVTVNVYNPLTIEDLESFSVAQYETSNNLVAATYDASGVMPSSSGGSALSFSVSPAMPNGLVLDESTGVISGGSLDGVGNYGPFTMSIADGSGSTASTSGFYIDVTPRLGLTLTVDDIAFIYSTEATLNPVVDLDRPPLSTDLEVEYSLAEGTLPPEFTLDPTTGAISGSSVNLATSEVLRIKAIDSEGYEAISNEFTLTVIMPDPIQAKTAIPVKTTVGYPVAIPAMEFVNTLGKITYTAIDELPAGLSLDPDTGIIIGQTNEVIEGGSYRISVTDAEGRTGEGSFTLSVIPNPSVDLGTHSLPIMASRLSNLTVQAVAYDLLGNAVYSVESGVLPEGTTLSDSGLISGVLTEEATYNNIVIRVTDSETDLFAVTNPFSIEVGPREEMTLAYPETMSVFKDLQTNLPIKPSVTSAAGSVFYSLVSGLLPNGLVFDVDTGFISGIPTEFGEYPITISAIDEDGSTDVISLTVEVKKFGNIIQPASASYQYRVGESFETNPIDFSNAVGSVEFSLSGSLPNGVIFSDFDGTILGSASESGTFTVTVSSTDTHMRTSNPSTAVSLDIVPELSVAMQPSNSEAHQYSGDFVPISQMFENAIGTLSYSLVGTLPSGLSFDTSTGIISGVPTALGTFTGLAVTAVDDYDGSTATTNAFSIKVNPPLPLIASLPDEAFTLVNNSVANIVAVTVENAGLGQPVSYAVSGTLPAGVRFDDTTGVFSGTAEEPGTYSDIYVTVTDALNRIEVAGPIAIKAILDGEPIVLNVSDVQTKIGYPFQTTAPTTQNSVGNVRFYSYDLVNGMTLDSRTGVLSGSFATAQIKPFDIYVGDDTTRVTSEPMEISVFPFVRAIYPSLITMAEQDDETSIAPDILYGIGTVTYEAVDPSKLPAGVVVNPTTGQIEGRPTVYGTFPGIQIRVTDVFDFGTDIQLSNVFSVEVTELDADPVIADIPSQELILGTVGTQITSYRPTVTDDVKNQPWVKPNTLYSLNYDLAEDTGLSFDPSTGQISGTPTSYAVYDDFQITVTALSGASDTTAPFRLIVFPSNQIAVSTNHVGQHKVRVGTPYTTETPTVDYAVGNVTFSQQTSQPGWTINPSTGVFNNQNPSIIGNFQIVIFANDEFNRKGAASVDFSVNGALGINDANSVVTRRTRLINSTESLNLISYVNNKVGNLTIDVGSLPYGLSFNSATGVISGTFNEEGETVVPVTITDDFDDVSISFDINYLVEEPLDFTCSAPTASTNPKAKKLFSVVYLNNGLDQNFFNIKNPNEIQYSDIHFFDENGNCITPNGAWGFFNPSYGQTVGAWDGDPDTDYIDQVGGYTAFDFGVNVAISKIVITNNGSSKYLKEVQLCRTEAQNTLDWCVGYTPLPNDRYQGILVGDGGPFAKGQKVVVDVPNELYN